MSFTRIMNKLNDAALPGLVTASTAVLGSVVLSRMGYRDHDALSAAGMATLGSIAQHCIVPNNYNIYTIFKLIKEGGPLKFATAQNITNAASLLLGASLFLIKGHSLKEISHNSADLAAGSIILSLPIAYAVIRHANKLIHDFEAQQPKPEQPSATRMKMG